jgi:hypothetical protein
MTLAEEIFAAAGELRMAANQARPPHVARDLRALSDRLRDAGERARRLEARAAKETGVAS